MKMLSRLTSMVLCLCMMFCILVSCDKKTENNVKTKKGTISADKYGLQVDENGVILLNGEPFYGMGVNWHGAFASGTLPKQYGSIGFDMALYFKPLKDNGVPFIRIQMGTHYKEEVAKYDKEPDKYFAAMDEVVAAAEKFNVGIIGSLMWNLSSIPGYVGETIEALKDPNSESMVLAAQYVRDVVKRYKDSPAIWAWEIGNEGNLGCDLGAQGGFLTTEILNKYYELIGSVIKENDPNRLITGGDSEPRGSSKALRETGTWAPVDTYEDTKETIGLYTPSPLNCISMHMYQEDKTTIRDFKTIIGDYVKMAKELKIAYFVGEFGAGSMTFANEMDQKGPEDPREALEQECWKALKDAILENDVQLSAAWCYRRDEQATDPTSIVPNLQNEHMWKGIVESNAKYISEGKNKAAEYWAGVTPLFN